MTASINNLLDFVSFTHEIRSIKRAMWVLNEENFENDSEHGYQLALVALYIIEERELQLDALRAMGIALVHDILEVHAGDTPVFGAKVDLDTQKDRERQAVIELKKQWPNLKLMHELIDEYENKSTQESKFIYALDKLLPMINNYLDSGRNWKRQQVSLGHVVAVKIGKIDIDSTVDDYYKQLLTLLGTKPEFFA